MKMSPDQLRNLGWVETANGWQKPPKKWKAISPAECVETMRPTVTTPLDGLQDSAGVSTDEAKLNKTEKAFLAHLREWYGQFGAWIGIQCITLKLAHDCRYTVDFWVWAGARMWALEVKGFKRDDAMVKLRVAARMYPMIRFTLVERIKGEWKFTEVKP